MKFPAVLYYNYSVYSISHQVMLFTCIFFASFAKTSRQTKVVLQPCELTNKVIVSKDKDSFKLLKDGSVYLAEVRDQPFRYQPKLKSFELIYIPYHKVWINSIHELVERRLEINFLLFDFNYCVLWPLNKSRSELVGEWMLNALVIKVLKHDICIDFFKRLHYPVEENHCPCFGLNLVWAWP